MKRVPLLLAILLSVLAHLALLSSGLLPSLSLQPDTSLQPIHMRLSSMDLAAQKPAQAKPAAPSAHGGIRISALNPRPAAAASAAQDVVASAPAARAMAQTASAPEASAPEAASVASAPAEEEASNIDSPASPGYLSAKHHSRHFPSRARLSYQVYYGALMAGLATIDWQRDGSHYRLVSQITPILGPRLRYQSEGRIGNDGLKPDNYNAWHNNESREHARFDWDNRQLEYGDGTSQQTALIPGAQDIFSLIYQLALKGAGQPPVQVTTGKKVYLYPLAPIGEADFDTGAGKIRALVFRAQGDGDQTEFWLAPDFANQPIRIIRSDSRMKLDMRVTDIVIDDENLWRLPKPIHWKNEK